MGVPKFFAYLMKKFKKSNFIFQKETSSVESIDWFMIDTNCLIHPVCFKILAEEQLKEKINFKSLENKMMNAVIEYMEKIINYANPIKGIYIAIDGPVACSKMKQQRQRRYKSVHDYEFFNKIKDKHNKEKLYYWSNSAISPGTKFMFKLHQKILNWCNSKILENKDIKIIYSSANTNGEGEHKILQFIKNNQKQKLHYSYLTYGLDADLIFLMLVVEHDNIYLLRESNELDKNGSKDQLKFVSIKIMSDCIFELFQNNKENKLIKKRIINDFIFLCYFLGNDFLPHLPALDINKNGIEYLINNYLIIFTDLKDYLLSKNKKKINYNFLNNFLLKIGKDEESILTKNLNEHKYKPKCMSEDPYEKELFRIDNLMFKINDPVGLGVDSNYRNNYYKHYFDADNDEEFIKELVKQYLIGIKWVTLYYFDKIPDWYWYFPYNNPPLLEDIAKYYININEIQFKINKPMSSFEQLLMILPPQSNFLLPNILSKIITNSKSSIAYLYPINIQIDYLYKRKYYEGIPLLPQMEIKSIIHTFKKYKDELTEDEINRNKILKEFTFN
jgi:5'-3' exonuclease